MPPTSPTLTIAYLGPAGTYTEAATLAYADHLTALGGTHTLRPQSTIAHTLQAVERGEAELAIVPVENSIQGSVTVTLDLMWQLSGLTIRQAIVLPIAHAFISAIAATPMSEISAIYSHPQALAQCQHWLAANAPQAQLHSTNSTTDALEIVARDPRAAAIASLRAAQLYQQPILAYPINDYPDNCTRFWAISRTDSAVPWPQLPGVCQASIAFSLPGNVPGALLDPLRAIASRRINLSRIESRPTKRLLGEYLFFVDCELESNCEPNHEPNHEPNRDHVLHSSQRWNAAIADLKTQTEVLKLFGTYAILDLSNPASPALFCPSPDAGV